MSEAVAARDAMPPPTRYGRYVGSLGRGSPCRGFVERMARHYRSVVWRAVKSWDVRLISVHNRFPQSFLDGVVDHTTQKLLADMEQHPFQVHAYYETSITCHIVECPGFNELGRCCSVVLLETGCDGHEFVLKRSSIIFAISHVCFALTRKTQDIA